MTWKWTVNDEKRVERARKIKDISIDQEHRTMECVGSTGEVYHVSLESCTCMDFSRKKDACKHMIRLAMELGILNSAGYSAEQQRSMDLLEAKGKLAYWYGCYYLFNDPVVSDREYDALKQKLTSEYGIVFQDVSAPCCASDPLASVRIYLDSQNYEYIDKTPQGGCLYFFDEKASEVITAMGIKVSFAAEGTRSTKHRPAWYICLSK